MKSPLTTLCYVERGDSYLMLHRVSKKNDVNKDKWIGIGGHFEEGESPEECLLREAYEETGLRLTSWKFRGIVTFVAEGWPPEYMCLYTADGFEGELTDCNEGVLEWVPKSEVTKLNLWEGDKIFLKLLAENAPFFSMKLTYCGDVLTGAWLNGREMELFDVCDETGAVTGKVTERSVAHTAGLMHRTAHIWVVREQSAAESEGCYELLMQKRSLRKNSFPGCYDVSSAGHIKAGDDYLESALRELSEELGIVAAPQELEYVGRFDSGDILAEFDGRSFHDREISAVYVYRKPVDAAALKLQEEEVDAVKWMPYETVLQAARSGDPDFCVNERELKLLGEYLDAKTRENYEKSIN
ncbi:MAG: NUDIX domain-containing protein [Lachnospiraceae bacterium]